MSYPNFSNRGGAMYKSSTFIIIGILLSGCVQNLASVRAFSTETTNLTTALSPFVDDLSKSCQRRVEISQIILPDDSTFQAGQRACEELAQAGKRITEINQVIVSYSSALSALAADDLATYTGELDSVNDALTKIKNDKNTSVIDKERASAGLSITGFILRAATDEMV
jgi:hypothetical protein